MKNNLIHLRAFLSIGLLALFVLLPAGCNTALSSSDQWRLQNEAAFLKYEKDEEYTKVTIDGLSPFVMMKWLQRGSGKEYPIETSRVKLHYRYYSLVGNTELVDGNYNQESSSIFTINRGTAAQVIVGLRIALQNMVVGDEAEIIIPWYLAYGEKASQGLRPYSALRYVVRLDGIVAEAEENLQ